jgi:hypothetical protein
VISRSRWLHSGIDIASPPLAATSASGSAAQGFDPRLQRFWCGSPDSFGRYIIPRDGERALYYLPASPEM